MSLETSIQDLITASGQQTERTNALNDTVANKIAAIDARQAAKDAEIQAKLDSVDPQLQNHPKLRLSSNQYGQLNGSVYDYWSRNGNGTVNFSLVRTISSGTPFADRPNEDQAVLAAMGHSGTHFSPSIRIIRMDWSGYDSIIGQWLFYDEQHFMGGQDIATGCYARLLSGSAAGNYFNGINSEWGQCGQNHGVNPPGSYSALHPVALTGSGSIEFFWPAVVAGFFEFDRENPKWSFFASPYGNNDTDTNT